MRKIANESVASFVDGFAGDGPEAGLSEAVAAELAATDGSAEEDAAAALLRDRKNSRIFGSPLASIARLACGFLALASAVWLLFPGGTPASILRLPISGSPFEMAPMNADADVHDAETKLLLHGDETATDQAGRWRALWMSEPENPVWFSRYANARLSEEDAVAADVLADAQRIDPDNGYWLLVAACVDADKLSARTKIPGEKSQWFATDEDEVLRRIAMIHEAAARPRLQSYQLDYMQTAIRKMPPVEGFMGRLQLTEWLASQTDAATYQIRHLPSLLEAGARIAMQRGDREMTASMIRDWHRLSRAVAEDCSTLVGVIIANSVASRPASVFHEAVQQFDLAKEAELLRPILAKITEVEAFEDHDRDLRAAEEGSALGIRKSSILASLTLIIGQQNLMDLVEPIDESSLRPGRRMEFAFFERLAVAQVGAFTFAYVFAFGVDWLRAGRMRRSFARRVLMLLPIWKLALLALAAGAGPLLWYLLITRLTPLGWLEWSLSHGQHAFYLQWMTLFFMIAMLPGLLAEIALEKSAKPFGWRWPGGTTWRAAAILVLFLALPASGLMLLREDEHWFSFALTGFWWLSLAGLIGVALAMAWSGWCQRKQPRRRSPRRLAAGLFAGYVRLLTLPLLVGWAWFTQIEEKAWTHRDTLMTVNPDSPALSSFEAEVQSRLRAQVIHVLGPAWPE